MKEVLFLLLTLSYSIVYAQNPSEIQSNLLNLVNEERANRGLSTFETDILINNGAKIQADYLSTIRSYKQVSNTNPNPKYRTASNRIKIASN